MLYLCNMQYPNICGGDIIFDLIWIERSQGLNTQECTSVAYPKIFFEGGGVQRIQLRTEDRENGDLGAVAP